MCRTARCRCQSLDRDQFRGAELGGIGEQEPVAAAASPSRRWRSGAPSAATRSPVWSAAESTRFSNDIWRSPIRLTPAEYRELFGLKRDYPMAAPSYVQERAEIAKRIGLGRPRKADRQADRTAKVEK